LVNAIGWREGNDALAWVRIESADIAAHLLGLDPVVPYLPEAFRLSEEDTRGPLSGLAGILETELMRGLKPYRLQAAYLSGEPPAIRAGFDAYIRRTLLGEEADAAREALRIIRGMWHGEKLPRRQAQQIGRHLDRVGMEADSPNLPECGVPAIRQHDPTGLLVTLDNPVWERTFVPVVEALNRFGVRTLWIRVGKGSREDRRDYPWGSVAVHRLLTPAELGREGWVRTAYREASQALLTRARHAPVDERYIRAFELLLPRLLTGWLAADRLAMRVFQGVRPALVLVAPESRILGRTFTWKARLASVPTVAYQPNLQPGRVRNEWKFLCDWFLVSCREHQQSLIRMGLPVERVIPVGSTWVDRSLGLSEPAPGSRGRGPRLLFLTKPAYKSVPNEPVLGRMLEVCARHGGDWAIVIRPHPNDRTAYAPYVERFPQRVTVVAKGVALQDNLREADLVVSGVSFAVWEAVAAGKRVLVVDWTGTAPSHLFRRPDLEGIVWFFDDLAKFTQALQAILERPRSSKPLLRREVVEDLLHSLDGKTAERIADFVAKRAMAASAAFRERP
jgi:hypothetical protein